MPFTLPAPETLYAALLARDPSWEGRAWVCVSSTGIFCRLTCPARKPLARNCTFHGSIGECLTAGFRPCRRCRPLEAAATDPTVSALLAALDTDPARRWTETDVAALGHDPSTVRRAFRRLFGITFLDMARQRRLREGFEVLAQGGRVIEAQLEAGFGSPSAFREAFARLLGCAPGDLRADALLRADWITTDLGDMIVVADATHLHLLEFVGRKALPAELRRLRAAAGGIGPGRTAPMDQAQRELSDFFAGRSARFDTPLALHGTPFTRAVWEELRRIPAGQTRSYADLARSLGRPTATRAVAQANGANQIAVMIPCHRVLGADGSLTGYGGGLWRKDRLLRIEAQYRPRAWPAGPDTGPRH